MRSFCCDWIGHQTAKNKPFITSRFKISEQKEVGEPILLGNLVIVNKKSFDVFLSESPIRLN